MFMDLLEKVYAIVEEATIATLGIGCENWRKCKCEDCDFDEHNKVWRYFCM